MSEKPQEPSVTSAAARESLTPKQGALRTAACDAWEMLLVYARSVRDGEVQTELPPALAHITQMREELYQRTPEDVMNAALEAYDAYKAASKGKCPLPFTRPEIERYLPILLQRHAARAFCSQEIDKEREDRTP